jgi:hypothetical protein
MWRNPEVSYNPFYKGSPVSLGLGSSFDDRLLGSIFGRNKTVVRTGYSISAVNGVGLY